VTKDVARKPVRVAVSGCGAVSELYYAPTLRALASEGRVEVVALSDPDDRRCDTLGAVFPRAARCRELAPVFEAAPQLLIIASPPRHHPQQALAGLSAEVDILCEKPLAISLADARRMADADAASGKLLAVGMVRRQMPAARMIRTVVSREVLGTLRRFEVFEGGPFDWPVHGTEYFDARNAGGGVLADIGTHVLDLLVWWMGSPSLEAAEDDAMGGVEANVRLTLRCGDVPGVVRLSRDWRRPNHITLTGSKGSLRWSLEDVERVVVTLDGNAPLELRAPAGAPTTFLDCFHAQLCAVLDTVEGKQADVVRAADLLPSIAIIERAYRESSLLAMPWLSPRESRAAMHARSPGAPS
jgi:predicted dehydrogenase